MSVFFDNHKYETFLLGILKKRDFILRLWEYELQAQYKKTGVRKLVVPKSLTVSGEEEVFEY